MRNRNSQRYQATRQELVQAAYTIIRTDGVNGLSMRKLAQIVNQSAANLYEYFENKEEIVLFVFAQTSAVLKARLMQVDVNLPPQEYLVALCFAYLEFAQRETGHMLVLQETAPATLQLRLTRNSRDNCPQYAAASSMEILPLFLAGVERYLQTTHQQLAVSLNAEELACVLLALVTGLATEVSDALSPMAQPTMRIVIQQFLSGLHHQT